MPKIFGRQKRSVVFYWSFSYTIILLFSLLIMLLVYIATQHTIKQQTLSTNEDAISYMVEQIDNRLLRTANVLYELQQNYTLICLNSYEGEFSEIPPYEAYQAYSRLGDAQLSLSFVTELMVYYPRTDSIISSVAVASSDFYHQVYIEPKGLSYERWIGMFKNVSKPYMAAVYYGDHQAADVLYYIRPHRNGTCFIAVIDPERFLSGIRDTNSELYLVDEAGRFVAGPASNQISWEALNYRIPVFKPGQTMDMEQHQVGADNYMISCMRSQASNWYYLASTPVGDYFSSYYWIQRFVRGGMAFYLLAGVVIVYMSIRSHYRPVRKLIEDVEGGQLRYVPNKGNEFIFLSNRLEGWRDEQNAILSQYRNREWCTAILGRILIGEQHAESRVLEGLTEYLNNNLAPVEGEKRTPACYLSAFYICDYGARTGLEMRENAVSSEMEDYFTYSWTLLHQAVENQYAPSNVPPNALLAFSLPVRNLYIVAIFTQVENGRRMLEDISRQICGEVNARAYMETKYVVSGHTYPLSQLPVGYQDLLRIITEQEQLIQRGAAEFPDLPCRGQMRPEILSGEQRRYLERLIRVNNTAQLREALVIQFQSYTLTGTATILRDDFPLFVSSIMNFSTGLIEQMHLNEEIYLPKIVRCVNESMAGDNPIAILRNILQLFEDISNDFYAGTLNSEENRHRLISHQIEIYIRQNYSDPNLSLSTISNHFEINASHISRIFRENTEFGIPDYINQVRIDQAKKILCSGQYTNLDNLATQVGYNNTKTLIRAFKRFENITPGQYKELYQDHQPI